MARRREESRLDKIMKEKREWYEEKEKALKRSGVKWRNVKEGKYREIYERYEKVLRISIEAGDINNDNDRNEISGWRKREKEGINKLWRSIEGKWRRRKYVEKEGKIRNIMLLRLCLYSVFGKIDAYIKLGMAKEGIGWNIYND